MSSRGYQSSQFFNIEQSRPDRWRTGAFVSDNALNRPFLFPDKSIRVPHGPIRLNTLQQKSATLEKGYIRRISEFDEGTERPLLCRFQFNPQYLNQQATFASGMTHPIYQEAAQLKQPMAAMTNFSFRLMFDRTMELNNGLDNISTGALRNQISDNPWEKGEPSQVGVLHDLSALYRVIGQGISSADIESAVGRAREGLAASRIGVVGDDEEDENFNRAIGNAKDFFSTNSNVNAGNTGFILPFPVRCVFSTLYIVEGFVTSTSMEILKFNSAYVPMVAQVTLAVNALYIGFAKSNTFFTHVLAQSAEQRRLARAQETANQNADVRLLRDKFSRLYLKVLRTADSDMPGKSVKHRPEPGWPPKVIRFNQLFDDVPSQPQERFTNPRVWANPDDWKSQKVREFRPQTSPAPARFVEVGEGEVADLFNSGALSEVSYKWKATIFGPFTDTLPPSPTLEGFLNLPLIQNLSSSNRSYASTEGSYVATTADQWLLLFETGSKAARLTPLNVPKIQLPSQFSASIDSSNKWVVLYEAECRVTVNGRIFDAKSFNISRLSRDSTSALTSILLFDWSSYFADVPPPPPPQRDPGEVYTGDLGKVDKTINARNQVYGSF